MTHGTLFIVLILLFFLLLATGQHISTTLYFLGFLGIYVVGGWNFLRGFTVNEAFPVVASYSLTTIPVYILMASFFMKSGAVSTLYQLVFNLAKGRKGPLGVLTILIGGLLGAVSGSCSATSAALGRISHEEMTSRGYSPKLSAGVISVSGSLSSIVPPSSMLIIYGCIASVSVGKLFMGALIPGVLTMIVFALTLIPFLNTKEEKAFQVDSTYVGVKLSTGKVVLALGSFLLIIGTIFGGIYTGLATPTEAGALGCLVAFIVAVINKQVTKEFLINSMMETAGTTTMCLTIMIGGTMFSRFVTLSGLTNSMGTVLAPIIARPYLLLAIIGVFYFIMFMFLDGNSTYVLTIPLLLPLVQMAGFDAVWFGVFISLLCTLGCLSPPVGFSVFATGAVVKDVPMSDIFKVAMIFAIVAAIVVGGACIVFPQTINYLPAFMS